MLVGAVGRRKDSIPGRGNIKPRINQAWERSREEFKGSVITDTTSYPDKLLILTKLTVVFFTRPDVRTIQA